MVVLKRSPQGPGIAHEEQRGRGEIEKAAPHPTQPTSPLLSVSSARLLEQYRDETVPCQSKTLRQRSDFAGQGGIHAEVDTGGRVQDRELENPHFHLNSDQTLTLRHITCKMRKTPVFARIK